MIRHVAHYGRHLGIGAMCLAITLMGTVVPAEATSRQNAAALIDPCHVLTSHLASSILKGPVQRGQTDEYPMGGNSLYVSCSYWLVARGFDGPFVELGIIQQDPIANGRWSIDASWRGNLADMPIGGFEYHVVGGIGDGAVWVKMLHELFVLKRPHYILLVQYRTNLTTAPTLAAISGVTRTILTHL